MPVGELADRLPVGRPAVSKHLRVLESAGLVEHRSQGTRNLYALAPEGLVGLQRWLVDVRDSALSSFAEHVAFLERLRSRGLLIAAGPLPEPPGAGMTIVRVPAGDDVDVHDLATRDDLSVVQGVLSVEVSPRAVKFTSIA